MTTSFRFYSSLKNNNNYKNLYKDYFREREFSESSLSADIRSLPLRAKSKEKLIRLVSNLANDHSFHEYDFNIGILDIYFLIRTLKSKVFYNESFSNN